MTDLSPIQYVADRLEIELIDLSLIQTKLYQHACTVPLTIEEMYKLRTSLTDISALTTMLKRDLEEIRTEGTAKPRWKKLFQK